VLAFLVLQMAGARPLHEAGNVFARPRNIIGRDSGPSAPDVSTHSRAIDMENPRRNVEAAAPNA
jgi:hypothetical protein